MAGRSFIIVGRDGCGKGGRSQLIVAPIKIAVVDKISMGRVRFGSSSWVLCRGLKAEGDHRSDIVRRRE